MCKFVLLCTVGTFIIFHSNNRTFGMHEVVFNGERYHLQKRVGSGYTSEVYKAVNSKGDPLCVKLISSSFYASKLGQELINNQIAILEKLEHVNILKFYKKEVGDRVMIVTEYCHDGTLYEYLQRKKTLCEQEALRIMTGIVKGCEHMIAKDILHRDLKPENIFLKGKDIKIADFGFAVETNNSKLMNIGVGSPLYMPYESLAEKKFSTKSDVFAMGVIWYELLTGKTPFSATSELQLRQKVKNCSFRNKDIKCSKKTQEIIFKCLSFKIENRPTVQELRAAIEEMVIPQKENSKSLFEEPTQKKPAGKENQGNNKPSTKDGNRLKTKQNKNTEVQSMVRIQRSKTFVVSKQIKKPFNDYIQANLSRRASQQKTDRTSTKPVPQTTSKPNESFLQFLKRMQQLPLPFLPISIQAKFSSLIGYYQTLLSSEGQPPKQSIELIPQSDEMLLVLSTCTKESQFCKCCLAFLRRLIRLAKTYKEWACCLPDLTVLWQRVQAKAK